MLRGTASLRPDRCDRGAGGYTGLCEAGRRLAPATPKGDELLRRALAPDADAAACAARPGVYGTAVRGADAAQLLRVDLGQYLKANQRFVRG